MMGEVPRFHIADRFMIEQGLDVGRPHVLISVHATSVPPPRVREDRSRLDILQLVFDDIEPIPDVFLPPEARLMTDAQARAIATFARRYADQAEVIVCQCDAGISRSAAIAAALCRAMGDDPRRFFRDYEPNRFVYQKVLEAMGSGRGADPA